MSRAGRRRWLQQPTVECTSLLTGKNRGERREGGRGGGGGEEKEREREAGRGRKEERHANLFVVVYFCLSVCLSTFCQL